MDDGNQPQNKKENISVREGLSEMAFMSETSLRQFLHKKIWFIKGLRKSHLQEQGPDTVYIFPDCLQHFAVILSHLCRWTSWRGVPPL